jgi:phage terminase large subunit-like protein
MDISFLTPKQKEGFKLLCEPTQVTGLYGGSRSGKTVDIAAWLFGLCLLRKSRHLILRKHLSSLRSAMWHGTLPKVLNMMKIPPQAYRFAGDCSFIKFANGSDIWMGGLDNLKRGDKILGNEYSTIWINEASEFDNDAIPNLQSRLAETSGIYNKLVLDFNPPETSHWTYDLIMNHKLVTTYGESDISINHMLLNPLDNLKNLPDHYIKILESMPERQRKRFLEGQFVSPEEAIFSESMIKWTRVIPPLFSRIVIGVDPATTNKVTSDETGIFIMGFDGITYYKLEDLSLKGSPERWAAVCVDAFTRYRKISKDCIICAEVNQGGDMVGSVIKSYAQKINVSVNYKAVRTSVSKQYRAEFFSIQLCTKPWLWNENHGFREYIKQFLGYSNMLYNNKSPDRVDAAIICASQLLSGMEPTYFVA